MSNQNGQASETGLAGAIHQLCQVSSADELRTLLPRSARALTRGARATLTVRAGDQVEVVAEDADEPLWHGKKLPLVDSIAGWCLQQHETVSIGDLQEDARVTPERLSDTTLRSAVVVPLRAGDFEAALSVYWTENATPRHEVQRVIEALAETAGLSLHYRQLLAERENGKK